MIRNHPYPIGRAGQPWAADERAAWQARCQVQRSYAEEVLAPVQALSERFDVQLYGELEVDPSRYPMLAVRSREWAPEQPIALITGGVHGYETSGVQGAIRFLEQHAEDYSGQINWLLVPCVSPWAYERIQRWNHQAVDPNRSFGNRAAQESAALLDLIAPLRDQIQLHIDLHETTDTDETEFRPALAARDGEQFEPGTIPDGFYLVDDSEQPQPDFQQAVIEAVSRVTHIAPADEAGQIIGSPVVAPGVIRYPLKALGLCAGITDARFRTTTEVYPDSPRANPEQCNAAQCAAICAALDYLIAALG